MTQGYEPKKPMGWVFFVVGAVVSLPLAVAKGGIDAIGGDSFLDGAAEVYGASCEMGAEFGDKYGGKIVSRVVSGLLLGFIGGDVMDVFHPDD